MNCFATNVGDSNNVNDNKINNTEKILNNKAKKDISHYEFKNDTVVLDESECVGSIIYTEHQAKLDVILSYVFPIIMLLLGVAIDRLIIGWTERKRIKKSGGRWINELESSIEPIKKQQEELKKWVTYYKNNPKTFMVNKLGLYTEINGEIYDSFNKEDLSEYIKLKSKKDIRIYKKNIIKEYYKKIREVKQCKKRIILFKILNRKLKRDSCVKFVHDVLECKNQTKFIYKSIKDSFDNFKKEVSNQYNIASTQISLYYNEILLLNDKDVIIPQDQYQNLIQLLQRYYANENIKNTNLLELPEKLIDPSLTILFSINNDNSFHLIKILRTFKYAISAIFNEQSYLLKDFENYIIFYNRLTRNIKKTCNKYYR